MAELTATSCKTKIIVTGEYVFELRSNMIVWAVLVRGWDSVEGEWVD